MTGTNNHELFADLRALSEHSFPKRCSTCGRVYDSPRDFAEKSSSPPAGTGLKASLDDEDQPVIELFRNCECGSTLMDVFQDRRDTSGRGLRRRQVFQRLLERLETKGMSESEARQELLRVLRGESSDKLEALGIHLATSR